MPLPITTNKINDMWEAYKKTQSIQAVVNACAVSRVTASKYVNRGDKKRGIKPFKKRLQSVSVEAARRADVQTSMNLAQSVAYWRNRVNSLGRNVEIIEKLLFEVLGSDGADREALEKARKRIAKDPIFALKVLAGAIKQVTETHQVLVDLVNPEQDKPSDPWFEKFTPEEHAAFRDRGEWPAHTPKPDWLGGPETSDSVH